MTRDNSMPQRSPKTVPADVARRMASATTPVTDDIAESIDPVDDSFPDAPQEEEEKAAFNVMDAIVAIVAGAQQIQASAAGFATMKQLAANELKPPAGPPILSWPASFRGAPVQVETDLANLAAGDRDHVAQALAAVHGVQMLQAVRRICQASTDLERHLERELKKAKA
jgi:hypothetical protein